MPEYDVKISGCDADGKPLQVGVCDGTIAAIGSAISGEGRTDHSWPDHLILPGWIDAHVHFNEPGRTEWEGIASGSQALAAGGGTAFFDMPLNSSPPVITAERLDEKRRLAEIKSWTDFALWGGLTRNSIPHLHEMAEAGAIGFKAFLCPSGLAEFPSADRQTLFEGAKIAADLQLPIAVHAEIENPAASPPTGKDFATWCASRPISMELAGIELALDAAAATGAAFHIVHVSSEAGVQRIRAAKNEGVNVTLETCPHYLLLNEDSGTAIGNIAKCAPPLRSIGEMMALRECIKMGWIDTLGSDHSPCPPELKESDDVFEVWGGIAGIQHGLPLCLGIGLDLDRLISQTAAERFRLPNKGGLRVGVDADLIVLKRGSFAVDADTSLTQHHHSPYLGMTAELKVMATFLRGTPITGPGSARFLKPTVT